MGQTISLPPPELQDLILDDVSAKDLGALAVTSKELRVAVFAFLERDALLRTAFFRNAKLREHGRERPEWAFYSFCEVALERLKHVGSVSFLENWVNAAISYLGTLDGNSDNFIFVFVGLKRVFKTLANVRSAPHCAFFWNLCRDLERFDRHFPAQCALIRLHREIERGFSNNLFSTPEGLCKIDNWCEKANTRLGLKREFGAGVSLTHFVTLAVHARNEGVLQHLVTLAEQRFGEQCECVDTVAKWLCMLESGISWLDERVVALMLQNQVLAEMGQVRPHLKGLIMRHKPTDILVVLDMNY